VHSSVLSTSTQSASMQSAPMQSAPTNATGQCNWAWIGLGVRSFGGCCKPGEWCDGANDGPHLTHSARSTTWKPATVSSAPAVQKLLTDRYSRSFVPDDWALLPPNHWPRSQRVRSAYAEWSKQCDALSFAPATPEQWPPRYGGGGWSGHGKESRLMVPCVTAGWP
jgi:hypothetical protein